MYTGTLIADLMVMVEQVKDRAEQRKVADELHEIFTMHIPVTETPVFMGAA